LLFGERNSDSAVQLIDIDKISGVINRRKGNAEEIIFLQKIEKVEEKLSLFHG
jgi:hypothetical protein